MTNDNPSATRSGQTTNTDFARSVDRAIVREIADMNLRGLRAVRAATTDAAPQSLPPALESLRVAWQALDDQALTAMADAPYLLFEWRVNTERPAGITAGWLAHAEIRRYTRILCHFAWHTSRVRLVAAPLLLGCSPADAAALAGLDLGELDALTESAAERVGLRWAEDIRHWERRLTAAAAADRNALWENTLAGVQRLAGKARQTDLG